MDASTFFVGQHERNAVQIAEFLDMGGMTYALFQTKAGSDASVVSKAFQQAGLPVVVMADIASADGQHSFLCKAATSPDMLLNALAKQGEGLQPESPKESKFNPWFWRGATSIVGQSLQIASSLNTYDPKKVGEDGHPTNAISGDVFGFAVLNLLANACNMTFGSQHKKDAHQLRYLKEAFNEQWQELAQEQGALPDVDKCAMDTRPKVERSFGQKLYDFAQQQSVTMGEVGLRMLGTTSLIFPINTWPKAIALAFQGQFSEAYNTAINPDPQTRNVGLATMVGKLSALVAKEEDPYNPEPPSAIDHFRQKIAFKLSSVIEGGAATYMMYDRFANKRSTFGYHGNMNDPDFNPKTDLQPDWFGTAGNFAFIDGYIMRYFASVGSLEVDMKELQAHVSDGLAALPREVLPDALASTSMALKLHFHDKKGIKATDIYDAIVEDLRTQHQIDIYDIIRDKLNAAYEAPAAQRPDLPSSARLEQAVYQQTLTPAMAQMSLSF